MKKVFKPTLLSIAISVVTSPLAIANDSADDTSVVEQLTIFGSEQTVNDIPGSAHLLSQEDLEKFNYSGPFIMQAYRDEEGVSTFKEQLDWVKTYLDC